MEKKITFEFWTEKTYGIKGQDGEWYNRSKNCKLTDEGIKNLLSDLKKGTVLTLDLDPTGKFYNSIIVGGQVSATPIVKNEVVSVEMLAPIMRKCFEEAVKIVQDNSNFKQVFNVESEELKAHINGVQYRANMDAVKSMASSLFIEYNKRR